MNKGVPKAVCLLAAAMVLLLTLGACDIEDLLPWLKKTPTPVPGPSQVRVGQATMTETFLREEDISLPNCGGTEKLERSLASQANIQRSIAIGAKARTGTGAEVAIPAAVKLKLEAEVELAYQNVFSTANSRMDTIKMQAAPGTEVVYVVEWKERKFGSMISYAVGNDVYEVPYTYILHVPDLKPGGSYRKDCSGKVEPGAGSFQAASLGTWGSEGDGDGQFRRPWGIGAAHEMVYVGDGGQNRVQIFSPRGEYLGRLPGTIAGSFLAVDSNGLVYALNYDPGTARNQRVEIYAYGSHELADEFGLVGTSPRGIAVDIYGEQIFVTDITDQNVRRYAPDGQVTAEWGQEGTGDGEFRHPWGIAMDRYNTGQIYVADLLNHRVQVFSPDGEFVAKWGTHGTGDGQFDFPVDVAVDTSGNVFVLDSSNARVQMFSPEGEFLGKWGSVGRGEGEFLDPYGIAVDLEDNVYVLDSGNHRVQVFRVARTR
jgi:hypothetical protein